MINLASFGQVIKASVSVSKNVPNEFFGQWRVISVCTKSTIKEYQDTTSVDMWILSRTGNIISLSNPVSGAKAQITVDDVNGQTVKFQKKTFHPEEESIETPILTLQGDKFSGTDKIIIKTIENGKLIKEDYVEYKVQGTKISGIGISQIFGK